MNCCDATARHFDETHVKEDLQRYRQSGPDQTTSILLESLNTIDNCGSTLLDVGSGVGVIPFELASDDTERITCVDISPSYIQTARNEAERRGIHDKITFVTGDFIERAEQLPRADLVTLDRVVCCYPDFEQLISMSAHKALEWYALTFPLDRWYVRGVMAFQNWNRSRKGDDFRSYVHPPDKINDVMRGAGFERHIHRRTFVWQIDIYRRVQTA